LQPDQTKTDAFVTRLSPSKSSLVYSTFLGSDGLDSGTDVTLDKTGNAYVAGYTDSTDFPTLNAYQAHQGALDAFLSKVSPPGSALVYSTYLGGGSDDIAYGLAVDVTGSAYLVGATKSADFPTWNPLQTDRADDDAFVTKFARSGSSFGYSTYFGGGGRDWGFGIAVDGSGSTYVVGDTESTDFPTPVPDGPARPGCLRVQAGGRDVAGVLHRHALPARGHPEAVPSSAAPALACSTAPLPQTFPLAGVCGIPVTTHSIADNVTVTEPTALNQLHLYPAKTITPLATTIYYSAGLTRANNGILLLGVGHLDVTCHQPSGSVHVVLDVTGYFAETTEP
jgi:hypothetical protein